MKFAAAATPAAWAEVLETGLLAATPVALAILLWSAARFPLAAASPPTVEPAGSAASAVARRPVLIQVRLRADPQGAPAWITVNRLLAKNLEDLRARVRALVSEAGGPAAAEVEFDCDYNLRYETTLAALAAVSCSPADDTASADLLQRVKFARRRKP
jgi:hypothetical protein